MDDHDETMVTKMDNDAKSVGVDSATLSMKQGRAEVHGGRVYLLSESSRRKAYVDLLMAAMPQSATLS